MSLGQKDTAAQGPVTDTSSEGRLPAYGGCLHAVTRGNSALQDVVACVCDLQGLPSILIPITRARAHTRAQSIY